MAHTPKETIASMLAKLGKGLTVCSGNQVSFAVAGRKFDYDTAQHRFSERTVGTCKTVSYAEVYGALESVASAVTA
jgi:hypothetical protein